MKFSTKISLFITFSKQIFFASASVFVCEPYYYYNNNNKSIKLLFSEEYNWGGSPFSAVSIKAKF